MPKTCFSDSTAEEDRYEPPRVVLRGFWDSAEEARRLALSLAQNPALISPLPQSLP